MRGSSVGSEILNLCNRQMLQFQRTRLGKLWRMFPSRLLVGTCHAELRLLLERTKLKNSDHRPSCNLGVGVQWYFPSPVVRRSSRHNPREWSSTHLSQ